MKSKKFGAAVGHTGALKVFWDYEHRATAAKRKQEARAKKKRVDAAERIEGAGPRGKVNSRPKDWSPALARKMEFLAAIGVSAPKVR